MPYPNFLCSFNVGVNLNVEPIFGMMFIDDYKELSGYIFPELSYVIRFLCDIYFVNHPLGYEMSKIIELYYLSAILPVLYEGDDQPFFPCSRKVLNLMELISVVFYEILLRKGKKKILFGEYMVKAYYVRELVQTSIMMKKDRIKGKGRTSNFSDTKLSYDFINDMINLEMRYNYGFNIYKIHQRHFEKLETKRDLDVHLFNAIVNRQPKFLPFNSYQKMIEVEYDIRQFDNIHVPFCRVMDGSKDYCGWYRTNRPLVVKYYEDFSQYLWYFSEITLMKSSAFRNVTTTYERSVNDIMSLDTLIGNYITSNDIKGNNKFLELHCAFDVNYSVISNLCDEYSERLCQG